MDHRSLEQQAKQLTNRAHNRERRRTADQRGEGNDYDDKPRKKRSEPLKAAQEAYAAALAAASMAVPPLQRCELCQATFQTDAQMQQHLAGPVHRKAEKKAADEAAKQQHLSQYSAVAADALQAAAWQDGRDLTSHRGLGQRQQQTQQRQQQGQSQQGQRNNQWQRGAREQQQKEQEVLTHEQMLAQARKDGPLSIDGWVPPSLPSAAQHSPSLAGGTAGAAAAAAAAAAAVAEPQQQLQQRQQRAQPQQDPAAQQEGQQQELGLLLPAYGGSSSEESEDEGGEGEAWHASTAQQQQADAQLQQQQDGQQQVIHRPDGAGAGAEGVAAAGSDSDDDSSSDESSDEGGGPAEKFVSFF